MFNVCVHIKLCLSLLTYVVVTPTKRFMYLITFLSRRGGWRDTIRGASFQPQRQATTTTTTTTNNNHSNNNHNNNNNNNNNNNHYRYYNNNHDYYCPYH